VRRQPHDSRPKFLGFTTKDRTGLFHVAGRILRQTSATLDVVEQLNELVEVNDPLNAAFRQVVEHIEETTGVVESLAKGSGKFRLFSTGD
jgi:hypothetical protein